MGSFLASCFGFAIGFALTCYRGLMLVKFWEWFAMSSFKGLPHLTIPSAIGLALLVACLTHQRNKSGEEETTFAEDLGYGFVKISVMFFIGWVITLFM